MFSVLPCFIYVRRAVLHTSKASIPIIYSVEIYENCHEPGFFRRIRPSHCTFPLPRHTYISRNDSTTDRFRERHDSAATRISSRRYVPEAFRVRDPSTHDMRVEKLYLCFAAKVIPALGVRSKDICNFHEVQKISRRRFVHACLRITTVIGPIPQSPLPGRLPGWPG